MLSREDKNRLRREKYALNPQVRLSQNRVWRESNKESDRESKRLSARKSYAKDPQKHRVEASLYREANRDKCLEATKNWRERNSSEVSERNRISMRARRSENPEKWRWYSRLYYLNNRERLNSNRREAYKKTEKVKVLNRARLSKQGHVSKELIEQVYDRNRQKNAGVLVCYLCHKPIKGKGNLEHKVPVCRGGGNEFGNLDVSHSFCNFMKGTRTVEEWFKSGLMKEALMLGGELYL